MSTVAWLLISDGRDEYHKASFASILDHFPCPDHVVQIDDRDHTLGFTGAVIEGWRQVLETDCDYVVHLELDFVFPEQVPLYRMIGTLKRHPHLTQMSLLRQPVNHEEKAAGGIVQLHPGDYHQCGDDLAQWVETKRFVFTTNPSVYSTDICRKGWPDEMHSEGVFSWRLLREDPACRCGIWGRKWDKPRTIHIGETRAGVGY